MTVESTIRSCLQAALSPQHLELDNESHMHSVPADSETHFRAVVVSDTFEGQRKVARHRSVYALLEEQLRGPVHALALHTYTPAEWAEKSAGAPASPNCLGGSKADAVTDQ